MSPSQNGLRYGPLGPATLHLCIDMQRLFADDTAWHAPSMGAIVPVVTRIARAHAERTIFARFVPAADAGSARGGWRPYYEHWSTVTLDRLQPGITDLVAPLAELVPPAETFDKATYGCWSDGTLQARLVSRGVDTLVVTGGETDVCVLASVLSAVDLGYRTVIVRDAVCSSSDAMHDAALNLLSSRFDLQVEIVPAEVVLEAWAV